MVPDDVRRAHRSFPGPPRTAPTWNPRVVPTLEELEGRPIPAAGGERTHVIRRCTELMRTDVDRYTVEDLRIMIGQQLGAFHLLPRAVGVLLDDPLAEGHFFPGDLLTVVMRLPPAASHAHAVLREALVARVALLPREDLTPALADAVAAFVAPR